MKKRKSITDIKVLRIFITIAEKLIEENKSIMVNSGQDKIFELISHHFANEVVIPFSIWGFDLSITKYVLFMWFISGLLIIVLCIAAKEFKEKTLQRPTRLMVLVESYIQFIRNDIVHPFLGSNDRIYLHFFCTQFLFILGCNLIGLFPKSVTVTSNLSVTMALAVVTFFFTQIYGMHKRGVVAYWKHLLPDGAPIFLAPLIVTNEFIGLFSKPFALMVRLFANMLAGHMIIFVLLYLSIMFQSLIVGVITVPVAVAVNILEILIAFIQAYIFTFLSAIFIGMAASEH
ncbi:MAG: F0F1 ATP synthase subunit A [bacterium]